MPLLGDLSGRNFVIVDDRTSSRDALRRMLNSFAPNHVDAVETGAQALEVLQKGGHFDCVIADLAMEPMNGLELLKAIRTGEVDVQRQLPVVMLTAHADAELVGAALALDANAFVAKPAARDDLYARLLRVLDEPPFQVKPSLVYSAVPTRPVETGVKMYRVADAPEGGILAADVLTKSGSPLLAAGQVLTPGVLARLQDLRDVGLFRDEIWIRS